MSFCSESIRRTFPIFEKTLPSSKSAHRSFSETKKRRISTIVKKICFLFLDKPSPIFEKYPPLRSSGSKNDEPLPSTSVLFVTEERITPSVYNLHFRPRNRRASPTLGIRRRKKNRRSNRKQQKGRLPRRWIGVVLRKTKMGQGSSIFGSEERRKGEIILPSAPNNEDGGYFDLLAPQIVDGRILRSSKPEDWRPPIFEEPSFIFAEPFPHLRRTPPPSSKNPFLHLYRTVLHLRRTFAHIRSSEPKTEEPPPISDLRKRRTKNLLPSSIFDLRSRKSRTSPYLRFSASKNDSKIKQKTGDATSSQF